jgi:sugar phosphate isomerase/epimerase
MKLGISTYTYTWAIGMPGKYPAEPLGFDGLIMKARKLGVGLIQVADNLPLDLLDEDGLIECNRNAADHGIQLEAGARGMTEVNLERYIRIAALIRSPILRFVIDGPGFTPDTHTIASIIRNALTDLKDKKIILALENYERLKAREFAAIVDRIGSDWVGICLDSVNSLGAGEGIDTVIELLGPMTVNLHIKEFHIRRIYHKMGFQIEGLPAGEGMLNIPWILEHISSRCNSAILELWTPPEEKLEDTIKKEDEWAQKSISYLKNIIQS